MIIGLAGGFFLGVLTFVGTNLWQGPVASYGETHILTKRVKVGGLLKIRIHYNKYVDCGGTALVILWENSNSKPRVIQTILLGDREPGSWVTDREIPIPSDAKPGEAIVREALLYSCDGAGPAIRSPPFHIIVDP